MRPACCSAAVLTHACAGSEPEANVPFADHYSQVCIQDVCGDAATQKVHYRLQATLPVRWVS